MLPEAAHAVSHTASPETEVTSVAGELPRTAEHPDQDAGEGMASSDHRPGWHEVRRPLLASVPRSKRLRRSAHQRDQAAVRRQRRAVAISARTGAKRPGDDCREMRAHPLARQRGGRPRRRDTRAESTGVPAHHRSCGREGVDAHGPQHGDGTRPGKDDPRAGGAGHAPQTEPAESEAVSGDRTRPPQAKGLPSISARPQRHSACAGARASVPFEPAAPPRHPPARRLGADGRSHRLAHHRAWRAP